MRRRGRGLPGLPQPDGRTLDFRETAPAAYTPNTLDPPGPHKTFTGHLPVGAPGTVAGMDAALQRYGTRTLRDVIAPAEALARTGFRVPTSLSGAMAQNAARLRLFPADARAGEITLERTTAHAPGRPPVARTRAEGLETNPNGSTTQVSVIDDAGGAVALTCTVEQEFGSAVVAPGTGVLLNNELTDFSAAGTANEPRAGKRPRSSMSPTIVVEDGRPILLTGGAGGSRIIMGALETIIARVDFGLTLAQAVDAERFDDQGSATLALEDTRIDAAALADLQARGWTLDRLGEYGVRPRIQLAGIEPRSGRAAAVSDSRPDRAALAQRTRARTTPLHAFCRRNPGACDRPTR